MIKQLAIIAAIFVGISAARGDEPTTRLSNTLAAIRIVRIDAPDSYVDVIQDFEKNCLGDFRVDDQRFPPLITVDRDATGDWAALRISVRTQAAVGAGPADAAEIADSVIDQLRSRLAVLVQLSRAKSKSEMNEQYRVFQMLQQRRVATEQKLKLLDDDLADVMQKADLADSSAQNARELTENLESQYETAEIDIAGKEARQAALTTVIAKVDEQVGSQVNSDPIVQQLEAVVGARESELDGVKKSFANGGSSQNMNQDIAALAEAKAAVLERKEAAAQAAGGDTLHTWNTDLLSLSVDLAELHARENVMKSRLEALKRVVGILEEKRSEADAMQASLKDVNDELNKTQEIAAPPGRDLAAREPKLTVVESKDTPAESR